MLVFEKAESNNFREVKQIFVVITLEVWFGAFVETSHGLYSEG